MKGEISPVPTEENQASGSDNSAVSAEGDLVDKGSTPNFGGQFGQAKMAAAAQCG